MFTCKKLTNIYKTQSLVANYCEFKLSRDIEKIPGPTSVYSVLYIDPSKTVTCLMATNTKSIALQLSRNFLNMQIYLIKRVQFCFSYQNGNTNEKKHLLGKYVS